MGKELFGTDGIRGRPGTFPLDDRTLYWVGRSLGDYLRAHPDTAPDPGAPQPRILIGMDTRESCTDIARRILMGLTGSGLQGHFIGVMTTPGVAHLVHTRGFSAGLVISASHNPYIDNGIKLFAHSGMKFPDEAEAEIEAEILRQKDGAPNVTEVKLEADLTLDRAYLDFLAGCVIPGASLAGMRIVLDCANGAATDLAPRLFRSLGAEVIAIHDRPDGRNINAACGALHPESLQREVVARQAALGVAFDGDGDRAIFVTATGKTVNGDGILLAAARYLKSAGQLKGPALVSTTMANLGLEHALARDGLRLARVPVGDRYVLEEMLRSGSNLGGEQSGHIIFLDDATTGDGLLTAVKVASLVALRGPLDALVADLTVFPQTILNVRVKSKPPLESLPEVARLLAEAEAALGDRGRIVLRYSGTEALARVMVEAETQADVDRWSRALAAAVQSAIGV
jgi:phosphoglucosamine mutase